MRSCTERTPSPNAYLLQNLLLEADERVLSCSGRVWALLLACSQPAAVAATASGPLVQVGRRVGGGGQRDNTPQLLEDAHYCLGGSQGPP